jgi:hypothetical protein
MVKLVMLTEQVHLELSDHQLIAASTRGLNLVVFYYHDHEQSKINCLLLQLKQQFLDLHFGMINVTLNPKSLEAFHLEWYGRQNLGVIFSVGRIHEVIKNPTLATLSQALAYAWRVRSS